MGTAEDDVEGHRQSDEKNAEPGVGVDFPNVPEEQGGGPAVEAEDDAGQKIE